MVFGRPDRAKDRFATNEPKKGPLGPSDAMVWLKAVAEPAGPASLRKRFLGPYEAIVSVR